MNAEQAPDHGRPAFAVEDHELDAKTHTIEVAGDVDLFSAPELKLAISRAIDEGSTRIIVDLTKATFVDSTTLGVLVGTLKRLRAASGSLAVVCPSEDMRRLFDLTGLERVFSIHQDVESAQRSVRDS
jgi:anti-sigma B factor antagonist